MKSGKYYTVDPYYPVQFFNECKEALKNNSVQFDVFIDTKPPFNWYFRLNGEAPVMVNFDVATNSDKRWLIPTVIPLKPNDDYLLLRRSADEGKSAMQKFTENTPLKESSRSQYGVFFTVKNKEQAERISRDYAGKIWYFGKYFNNKFRVCLCTNSAIKVLLSDDQVLLEKTTQEPGRFEAELNYRVFKGEDSLVKFTETAYFEGGTLHRPTVQGDRSGQFNL